MPRKPFFKIFETIKANANAENEYLPVEGRKLARKFYDLVKTTYKLTDEEIAGYWDDKVNSAIKKYLSLTGEVMAHNAGKRHYIDRTTTISTSEDANIKTKIHITEPIRNKIIDLINQLIKAIDYEKLKGFKKRPNNSSHEKNFLLGAKGSSNFKNKSRFYRERSGSEQIQSQNFSLTDEELSEKERKKLERENEARAQITSLRARIVQATTDAFAPLAALERVLYGKVRGTEKSAWKMALMTKNLDQVMFHILRIGGITYDKAAGEMKHRKGSVPLAKILQKQPRLHARNRLDRRKAAPSTRGV